MFAATRQVKNRATTRTNQEEYPERDKGCPRSCMDLPDVDDALQPP